MTKLIQIQDIAQYDGQAVQLRGWVYNRTGGSALVSGDLLHVTMNAGAPLLLTDAVPGEGFPPFDTTLFVIGAVVVALFGLAFVVRTGGRLGYEPRSEATVEASG